MRAISLFINNDVWGFQNIQNFMLVLSMKVTFKDILKAIWYWNEEETAFGFIIKFMSISHKAAFVLFCFLVQKEVSTLSEVCRREVPLCFSGVWRAEGSREGQIWHKIKTTGFDFTFFFFLSSFAKNFKEVFSSSSKFWKESINLTKKYFLKIFPWRNYYKKCYHIQLWLSGLWLSEQIK